jgi:hypothetical protein
MFSQSMGDEAARAYRELEEAEEAVAAARVRFIEATNRATSKHRPQLRLVEPEATSQRA